MTNDKPKCSNAEAGTYNHECRKPAQWRGTNPQGYTAHFCGECKQSGYEARIFSNWQLIGA